MRRGDQPVELTRTEFELLRFLMLNPRRVLTKRQILDNVWHYDFGGDANVVETYISYLRKKLDPLGPPLIQTVGSSATRSRGVARAVAASARVGAAPRPCRAPGAARTVPEARLLPCSCRSRRSG